MIRKKMTMDGNQAAAHVSYAYSEVAAIYPITPSSPMAEHADEWATQNRKNIFGQEVQITEMQSEAGAAGAVHGSLAAGALTTTFTASQGLLLMIPNLYKIAGELLPGVFNVAARTVASHALSIFGDHSDIYACRQTGAAILVSGSVQEVMDLTPAAHLAAIKGRIPFINCFDGFRTSHEMQKIEVWDYDDLKDLADMEAIKSFRKHCLNPNHAREMGSAQNSDVFFQAREACNIYYDYLPEIVEVYLHKINYLLKTNYGLFNYHGAPDATHVIVAMGSACESIEETVDYLNAHGEKVGVVKVHLYRPFSAKHLLSALPDSVAQITVLDRTKEPGSIGEPLYLDVVAALRGTRFHNVPIFSGRYGLSSKDTTPDQIAAVFHNTQKSRFTVGINDDVTYLSLPVTESINAAPEGTVCCKFWGLGGDGTVSANKNSIKIIGNHTDQYVQAYFDYDSKKSMGLTVSHLRFGSAPIHSTYLIHQADFVACHNAAYLYKYNMVQDVKDNGVFLLNCYWSPKEVADHLPGQVKRYMAQHHVRFYIMDAQKIAREIGLGNKISTILQAAFFCLTGILPIQEAERLMKEAARASYQKKGDAVVAMNYAAIDRGINEVVEVPVPQSWLNEQDTPLETQVLPDRPEVTEYVEKLLKPILAQEGNSLPVSAFMPYVDGSAPSGSSAHERRSVASDVPEWNPENCIQCNQCSYVCPHAVIRPVAMTEEEKASAPKGMVSIPMMGMPGYEFSMTISEADCTGCGSCVAVCPGRKGQKALSMCPVQDHASRQEHFDYGKKLPVKNDIFQKFKATTVKGSQFSQPLLEFSGACAGCGETPYAKLVTQLFGDHMYIANATGCSSIWGNSNPSTPYTCNANGQGPAWSNSLFEDAAEFGYGMLLAQRSMRDMLKVKVEELLESANDLDFCLVIRDWLDSYQSGRANKLATQRLIDTIEKQIALFDENGDNSRTMEQRPIFEELLEYKDFLGKKSNWVFGGDGWAYDIGFGGLDHILASGQNINVLVFDTEVYSNTGGQSSKSTPTGSTAKFAAGGKDTRKKDLAGIAMSYGNVYVAQIAMGADYSQTIKAIVEAESYDGPSLIIAYAPCINHGIRAGMNNAQLEEAKAVKSGYWHLFRYNPVLKEEGRNPFILDSQEPTLAYEDFLTGEVRYDVLMRSNPERAKELFARAEKEAKERLTHLKKLAVLYGSEEAGQ